MPPKGIKSASSRMKFTGNSSTKMVPKTCSSGGIKLFLLLSIGTILFVLIFLSMYRAQVNGVREMVATPVEKFESGGDKDSLYFFHMTGCGWCERFMPVWEEVYGKYSKLPNLNMQKVERSESLAKKYADHITGYPTILLVKTNGKVITFSGERTVAGIESFLSTNGVSLDKKESFEVRRVKSNSNYKNAAKNVQGDINNVKIEMEKNARRAGPNQDNMSRGKGKGK